MEPTLSGSTDNLAFAWSRYRAFDGRFDEAVDASGKARPAWNEFLDRLGSIPRKEFAKRWEEGLRVIHENGVTYNVYGDDEATERPWELDPVPLVLSEPEWRKVEAGLIQRAELLNRVLLDFYGPRKLLKDKIVPPEILFANPGYLRPCVGAPIPKGRFLHVYSADIARGRDGSWWVLSDRTQAPSGMGYALENRLVQSRMIPEIARECGLLRMAQFFRTLLETLAESAPRSRDDPRVVLLTPGPKNETYFEQAFLARYLGIALVEGDDLAVREDYVYLKTLDGLQRVDVILRRLDQEFLDPLELRSDSQLGVAGLLGAIRKGNVSVLNPPGSGLAEAPALLAFLPNICRELLGEELLMPSVATWWCGQPAERSAVLGRFNELVILDAFAARAQVRFPGGESEASRMQLLDAVRADPNRYAAQERVRFSTAPVWRDAQFEPRSMALRVHLVATKDGYAVMPGGLTRFAGRGQEATLNISMQEGGGSKDTWIVSERKPQPHQTFYDERYPIELRRGTTDFPSRSADNLFWLGRYAERSEFTARLLRQVLARVTSSEGFRALPDVAPLWSTLEAFGHFLPAGGAAGATVNPETAITQAIFDENHAGSLTQIHLDLQRLASTARGALSLDTWRITQDLASALQSRVLIRRLSDMDPLLDRVVTLHSALAGLASENTTRSQGWRFLDLGRRLERALYIIHLGKACIGGHTARHSAAALDSVLESIDSAITYRRRHYYGPRLLPVLDLLLYDPANPRSLAFQLERIDQHLGQLPAERPRAFATDARKRLAKLLAETRTTELRAADAVELLAGPAGAPRVVRRPGTELADGRGVASAREESWTPGGTAHVEVPR